MHPPQSSECLDAWLRGHIPAPVSGRPGALGPCSSRQTCVLTSSHTTVAGQGLAGPLTSDPSPPLLADTALCPPRAGPSLSYGHQAGVLSSSRELPEFKESCFFSRTRLCGRGAGAQGQWTPGQRGCFQSHGWAMASRIPVPHVLTLKLLPPGLREKRPTGSVSVPGK